jgi:hypothetical protein
LRVRLRSVWNGHDEYSKYLTIHSPMYQGGIFKSGLLSFCPAKTHINTKRHRKTKNNPNRNPGTHICCTEQND